MATVDEAVRAAEAIGYPVALKATAAHLRHRRELGGVRLDLDDADELRAAFAAMRAPARGAPPAASSCRRWRRPASPPGCATVEDPLFGPVVSFGLGGVATDLLGDRSYGVPPLTDSDLATWCAAVRAAPLLLGHGGSTPVDVAALEDLLARLARLADDVPEVADAGAQPGGRGARRCRRARGDRPAGPPGCPGRARRPGAGRLRPAFRCRGRRVLRVQGWSA